MHKPEENNDTLQIALYKILERAKKNKQEKVDLENICISDFQKKKEEYPAVLAALPPSVKKVDFYGCDFQGITSAELERIFTSVPCTVTELRFKTFSFGFGNPDTIDVLANALPALSPSVKAFSLECNGLGYGNFVTVMVNMPKTVTILNLARNCFYTTEHAKKSTDQWVISFAAMNSTIEELDLSHNDLGNNPEPLVCEIFSALPRSMKKIDLSYNYFNEKLFDAFKCLPKDLTSLNLFRCFTNVAAHEIDKLLKNLCSFPLKNLYLGNNTIGYSLSNSRLSLKNAELNNFIIPSIPPSIEMLDISENHLGDWDYTRDWLIRLIELLPKTIRCLNLKGNNLYLLSDLQWESFRQKIAQHPSVNVILADNKLSEARLSQIEATMRLPLLNYQHSEGHHQGLVALCLAKFFRGGRDQPKGWSLEKKSTDTYIFKSNSSPFEMEVSKDVATILESIFNQYAQLLSILSQSESVSCRLGIAPKSQKEIVLDKLKSKLIKKLFFSEDRSVDSGFRIALDEQVYRFPPAPELENTISQIIQGIVANTSIIELRFEWHCPTFFYNLGKILIPESKIQELTIFGDYGGIDGRWVVRHAKFLADITSKSHHLQHLHLSESGLAFQCMMLLEGEQLLCSIFEKNCSITYAKLFSSYSALNNLKLQIILERISFIINRNQSQSKKFEEALKEFSDTLETLTPHVAESFTNLTESKQRLLAQDFLSFSFLGAAAKAYVADVQPKDDAQIDLGKSCTLI